MRNLGVLVVAVAVALALTAGTASAQDARAVIQAATKAMGNLKSVQITGTGWNAGVGQSFSPEDDWPRFEVTRYVRTIDFEAGTSREEFTRRQGNNPPRGGGGTPIQQPPGPANAPPRSTRRPPPRCARGPVSSSSTPCPIPAGGRCSDNSTRRANTEQMCG